MRARIAEFRCCRLPALALVSLLTTSAELRAQGPSVAFADRALQFGSPPAQIDAGPGRALLIIKIEGIAAERLNAFKLTDVILAVGADNYTPEMRLAGPIDRVTGEIIADPRFIFIVPRTHTTFQLRLPDAVPISFSATGPIPKTWTYR